LWDYPIWRFEVCGSRYGLQGDDVRRRKEEWVRELIFIEDKGRGKSKVGVQFAEVVGTGERCGGKGDEEGRVEACGGRETSCVALVRCWR